MFIDDFRRYDKLKNITFYTEKGGKAINIPKDSIDFNDGNSWNIENPWIKFNVNRIEFNPSKFSSKPSYATGIFVLNLADVRKSTYTVNNLPLGITTTTNKLLIDDELANNNNNKFFVKDKTGKYLKLITSISYKRDSGSTSKSTQVNYYYGIPHSIERYEIGDMRTVEYKFELELKKE